MAVKSKLYLDDMFWRPQTYCTVCRVVVQTLQLIRYRPLPRLICSIWSCVYAHIYLKLGQANAAGVLDAPTPEVPAAAAAAEVDFPKMRPVPNAERSWLKNIRLDR